MKKRGFPLVGAFAAALLVDERQPMPSVRAFWKDKKCETCDYCIDGVCYCLPPLTRHKVYDIGCTTEVVRPRVARMSACGQWKEKHGE